MKRTHSKSITPNSIENFYHQGKIKQRITSRREAGGWRFLHTKSLFKTIVTHTRTHTHGYMDTPSSKTRNICHKFYPPKNRNFPRTHILISANAHDFMLKGAVKNLISLALFGHHKIIYVAVQRFFTIVITSPSLPVCSFFPSRSVVKGKATPRSRAPTRPVNCNF